MTFAPKSILVPVDVDPQADLPLAERLVDDAAALAKLSGASLTLLHIAVPIMPSMAAPIDVIGSAYRAMLDVIEARNTACVRALGELAARAKTAGVTATTKLATEPGSVPQAIVDVAKRDGADLIVMTTHGRRGIKRLLLGSVAERTAHLATIPVLLLPPPA